MPRKAGGNQSTIPAKRRRADKAEKKQQKRLERRQAKSQRREDRHALGETGALKRRPTRLDSQIKHPVTIQIAVSNRRLPQCRRPQTKTWQQRQSWHPALAAVFHLWHPTLALSPFLILPDSRLHSKKFIRVRRPKKYPALCSARFDVSPRAVYE